MVRVLRRPIMERRNAEPSLVDGLTADLGGPRTADLLTRLDQVVPWETLAKPVRTLYNNQDTGAPAWPAVMMLKCLMLAKWYGLSDPQLEEHLKDRLSFRRFVGLSLIDKTPDETTFVTFRDRLRAAELDRTLFEAAGKHLETLGVLVKEGTLVDATIIEAPRGRKKDDHTSTRDTDASFTKKHGRTHHGYKGHIAADQSGIVTDYRFSTASHHDSRCFDELTRGEKKAAFGDSAYADQTRRRVMRSRGVIDAIVYKRRRGQKSLYDWQERWNTLVSKTRARVEHSFARIKQMGYRRVRYRGLRRNELDFALTLIAHNCKRALSLV
jgi:transposase, IS5 family